MAKAIRATRDMRGENAVAAGQTIAECATKIGPALATLTGRNEGLAQSLAETEAELEAVRAEHKATVDKLQGQLAKLQSKYDAHVAETDSLKHAIGRHLSKPLTSTGKSPLAGDDD